MSDDEILAERLDALCDELARAQPGASLAERWSAVLDRLPPLRDPVLAKAVQTLRFNTTLADLIGNHLARGEYRRLYDLGMTGIWIGQQRYLWPDFRAIPIEPAHAAIRAAPAPLDGALIRPESRLIRAILRVLIADPRGLAFYELAVRWDEVFAGWSRPQNPELEPMDETQLTDLTGEGPFAVVQPDTVLGIGREPVEAAHEAYANDAFLFELGARLRHYAGGSVTAADDVLYLAPCSVALVRYVLVHGGAGVAWRWGDGRLRMAHEGWHRAR